MEPLSVLLHNSPFWRDIWLVIVSFLLFLGTLFVYFRLRSHTFRRIRQLLEERVEVKTRQLVEKTVELEKLSLVAARTDNAVLIAEPDERIEWVNEGFLRLYSFEPDEVIGKRISEIGLYQQVSKELEEAKVHHHSRIFESEIPDADNHEKWISSTLTPIYEENGRLKKILIVDADITSTKKMQRQIQKSLQEKDVLLKEIHHRVKNNLQIIISLLNLQSGYLKDESTLKAVKDGQLRVRSMALVHEKFYQAEELTEINFGEYIEKLCQYLYQAYGDKTDRIRVSLNTEPIGLDMDTAMPCGLLINEIVSNSYKYAFPGDRQGEIGIKFRRENGQILLEISDNGIGFPAGFDVEKAESLGMQLIQALTLQIDGQLEVEKDHGARFSVRFTYPKTGTAKT